ncbi:aminobenzoate synthetase [Mycobacterium sp. GA-2829]|uniref:aminobenzoate synthetase n=1 Tax=Mycobacterium sp. GA-2829 TaxID=1772283 RepID=UPI0007400CD5|nr:aminobenzoate synthetase [Mycobacterium sp. GA-2829]KUI35495.1 aminobenzoate synthetase [Mycobacterium sp. GA-2829]
MEVDDLARRLSERGARTVLVDGRSGSGKSTLAARLSLAWESSVIVALDDIYPGWGGLAWAVDHVRVALLEPRAVGRPGRWRTWDWATDAPGGWRTVDPDRRIIVEGVGALTAPNRALADQGIWVDAPDDERKRRALRRDGEVFAAHWDRWATQEDAFIATHDPRSAADWIVTNIGDTLRWTAALS